MIKEYIHSKGVHFYNKPIKLIKKDIYRVEGEYDEYESKTKHGKRYKCQFCKKHKDRYDEVVTNSRKRG